MAITEQAIVDSVLNSIETSKFTPTPYEHWFLRQCLPQDVIDTILALPFEPPPLDGVSGKRELHNNTRKYYDAENMGQFPVCQAFNDAFQSKTVTDRIEQHFGTSLDGSYLRVEIAQDTDGFWLEPHTDLGVKLFTMLLYTSKDPSHAALGTDIYDADKGHVGRSPFESNAALQHHLPRLRAAQDRRRAQVDHHQLRDQRLARTRAARIPHPAHQALAPH